VDTPPALARRLVSRTLGPLLRGRTRAQVLALRVLDPACGAGELLLAAYDRLARVVGRRAIECLHGVDIDPAAVAVARAALAACSGNPEAAARAIRRGDGLSVREPFDAVIANPPWVEPRRWRGGGVDLSRFAVAQRGKVDLSLAFLERAAEWLAPGGRAGFLIQSRFFKTEYGAAARRLLRGMLAEIEDFRDAPLFEGRATYTAMLILESDVRATLYKAAGRSVRVQLDEAEWNFGDPELVALDARLAARHGRLGDHSEIRICVGLQTLYGRVYRIVPQSTDGDLVRGQNGLGEVVTVERAALRPLCRNRGFAPLRGDVTDAFVIFPYDGDREIRWPEFAARFPRAAAYLRSHRETLAGAVELPEGRGRWHLYTRPQNLRVLAQPKVLFPMTVRRIVAAVDERGDVYPDNVNVNALLCDGVDLYTLAGLLCSRMFDRLARLHAGQAQNGFLKFNRQFAARVPFPLAALSQHGAALAAAARAHDFAAIDRLAEELYA
jgi:SAM-dependent methyltransferase